MSKLLLLLVRAYVYTNDPPDSNCALNRIGNPARPYCETDLWDVPACRWRLQAGRAIALSVDAYTASANAVSAKTFFTGTCNEACLCRGSGSEWKYEYRTRAHILCGQGVTCRPANSRQTRPSPWFLLRTHARTT